MRCFDHKCFRRFWIVYSFIVYCIFLVNDFNFNKILILKLIFKLYLLFLLTIMIKTNNDNDKQQKQTKNNGKQIKRRE